MRNLDDGRGPGGTVERSGGGIARGAEDGGGEKCGGDGGCGAKNGGVCGAVTHELRWIGTRVLRALSWLGRKLRLSRKQGLGAEVRKRCQ